LKATLLLLHLVHVAAALVRAEPARVADGEGVRADDLDRLRGGTVEFRHARDLGEGHVIAVLEAVA